MTMRHQTADTAEALMAAAAFAARRHHGQLRSSSSAPGVPYIVHCFDVAELLARFGVGDTAVLTAAILHDVVEDTDTRLGEVERVFGARVAQLVGWLTLPQGCRDYKAKHAHQLQMMAEMDVAGCLIKVADKCSNVGGMLAFPPKWSVKAILGYARSAYEVVHAPSPLRPDLDGTPDAQLVAHFDSLYAPVLKHYEMTP